MPEIVSESVDEAKGAFMPGVKYGLATGLGRSILGPIGHTAGGIVAGGNIGGSTGATMSALAVSDGINQLMFSQSASAQSGGRGRV